MPGSQSDNVRRCSFQLGVSVEIPSLRPQKKHLCFRDPDFHLIFCREYFQGVTMLDGNLQILRKRRLQDEEIADFRLWKAQVEGQIVEHDSHFASKSS